MVLFVIAIWIVVAYHVRINERGTEAAIPVLTLASTAAALGLGVWRICDLTTLWWSYGTIALGKRYFGEILMLILSFFVVIAPFLGASSRLVLRVATWNVFAVVIAILAQLSAYKAYGPLLHAMSAVVYDLRHFGLVFIVLALGASFSFFLNNQQLQQPQDNYRSWWLSIFSMMMTVNGKSCHTLHALVVSPRAIDVCRRGRDRLRDGRVGDANPAALSVDGPVSLHSQSLDHPDIGVVGEALRGQPADGCPKSRCSHHRRGALAVLACKAVQHQIPTTLAPHNC